jgi:hypothetical protein
MEDLFKESQVNHYEKVIADDNFAFNHISEKFESVDYELLSLTAFDLPPYVYSCDIKKDNITYKVYVIMEKLGQIWVSKEEIGWII